MKYICSRPRCGNLGDDLNSWLWPYFFGDDCIEDDYFIGIGTILNNKNKRSNIINRLDGRKKNVFGTGVRRGYDPFTLDDSFDVKFLRGPLSAAYFNNKYEYITDGAYAIRLHPFFDVLKEVPKKYDVSVMPHFYSLKYVDWEAVCRELGYHFISPCAPEGVEYTMREIAASKRLITEAMHGAIVADLLRVPWSRFTLAVPYCDVYFTTEFKWQDWLNSINISYVDANIMRVYRRGKFNRLVKKVSFNMLDLGVYIPFYLKKEVVSKLSFIVDFHMSDDQTIAEMDQKIQCKIIDLQREYSCRR